MKMPSINPGKIRAFIIYFTTSSALFLSAQVSAQVELKNDGFNGDGQVGCQGGFISGEIGASRFVANSDQYPVRLQKIRILFSGDSIGAQRDVKIKIWRELSPPSDSPGDILYDEEMQLTASNSELSEVDVSGAGLSFDGPFRVGVEFRHDGFPSICRDDDGSNNYPDRNFIYGAPLGFEYSWNRSLNFGVLGDWIIRAEVSTSGGGNNANNDPNNGDPNNDQNNQPADLFINSVSPGSGPADEETRITISGMGFDNSTFFRVGSQSLVNLAIQSNSSVTGTLPAEALPEGSYDVIASKGAETFVYTDGFLVIESSDQTPGALSLISVSPTSAEEGIRTQVNIIGSGFPQGQPVTARVGSFPLESAIATSESVVTGTLPDTIPAGTYDVILTVGAETVTLPSGFTVLAAPEIEDSGGCACTIPSNHKNNKTSFLLFTIFSVFLIITTRRGGRS
jgi:hypothetical protein